MIKVMMNERPCRKQQGEKEAEREREKIKSTVNSAKLNLKYEGLWKHLQEYLNNYNTKYLSQDKTIVVDDGESCFVLCSNFFLQVTAQ